MAVSRRFLLVTAALTAAVLAAGSIAGAGAQRAVDAKVRDFPTFLFAPVADGALRGNIAAVQRTKAPSADVFVSLHGLTPASAYRGSLTDLACGRAATNADVVADLMGTVNTRADQDDFFSRKTTRLRERLARGTTFRLYRGETQIACVKVNRVR